MNPRSKFFLAVVAVLAGCLLLLTLPYDRSITKHAGEVFLGAVLLVGGMIFLWRDAKP